MEHYILESEEELGKAAAQRGGDAIREAIQRRGAAAIVLATGMSQVSMLSHLIARTDIDWSVVTAFHLDEYVDLSETHGASFRKYLKERFASQVPALSAFHFVKGDAPDPQKECRRLNDLISQYEIDVAFVGIGENGHLAFNDPPADFETASAYIIVELDDACRRQQVGEGWFSSVEQVPARAITMTVQQILKSLSIVAAVPGDRKAEAIQCALSGPVDPNCPASILQRHANCHIYLDRGSASRL